jgi:hypothetical protein
VSIIDGMKKEVGDFYSALGGAAAMSRQDNISSRIVQKKSGVVSVRLKNLSSVCVRFMPI